MDVGLAPYRWQAIIRTGFSLVYWFKEMSPYLDYIHFNGLKVSKPIAARML